MSPYDSLFALSELDAEIVGVSSQRQPSTWLEGGYDHIVNQAEIWTLDAAGTTIPHLVAKCMSDWIVDREPLMDVCVRASSSCINVDSGFEPPMFERTGHD
jgi:hypothetical protein